MKKKTKFLIILGFLTACLFTHTDAANWKMVQLGEEFETGDIAITEFVDIDSIHKTDKTTKEAWIRLFDEHGKETHYHVLFTKNGMMRMTGSDPPNQITNDEWQTIEPDSYWEKAYFEVWTEKEREVPSKKKPNKWKQKGKAAAEKARDKVLEKIGL